MIPSSSLLIQYHPSLVTIPMTADPHVLKVMEEALIASCQLGLVDRAEVLESPVLVVRFEWRGSGSFVSLYWRALEALNDLKSEIVLMQPV